MTRLNVLLHSLKSMAPRWAWQSILHSHGVRSSPILTASSALSIDICLCLCKLTALVASRIQNVCAWNLHLYIFGRVCFLELFQWQGILCLKVRNDFLSEFDFLLAKKCGFKTSALDAQWTSRKPWGLHSLVHIRKIAFWDAVLMTIHIFHRILSHAGLLGGHFTM